ncbi:Fc receptor-like protein 5 isoform X2 [Crocuta crocuta]
MSSSGLLRRCTAPRSKPALFLLRKTLIWPQPRAGQAFMLLWVTVLVLEAASKPVISLHPPWTVVFKGETVTLTCNVFHFHAPEKRRLFLWYLGERKLHETSGNSLEVRDSGQYRCQTQDSLPSDHVSLTFSSANLILQGPPYVFEGDAVVLRCRANAELALNATTFYRRGKVLRLSAESSHFHIQDAGLKDNGDYHCSGFKNDYSYSSNTINIQVQELFPRPVLTARPSWSIIGKSVTLTCETQLPPQRSDVKLWFYFFQDGQKLEVSLKNFLKTSTTTMRGQKPQYYWCEACRGSSGVCKQSQKVQLHVPIPVSRPSLTLSPPGATVPEGHMVTLSCKAERGSFPILYQFLREEVVIGKMEATQGTKSLMSLKAKHSGNYYCTADNGLGPQRSPPVYLTVIVPVSRPVLTIRKPRAQAVEGDKVELHCEAPRGSHPILYRFYHEGDALGSSWDYHGGGGSLTLQLTAEHSGEYACEADNGRGAQRSEAVPLSVTVPASRPVLTVRKPRAQAVEGDKVELHCESPRGSPPILYRFYHEGDALGNSSAPSGGGASFNLSLTAEHSGNYSCEADNGLGAQCSEAVSLSIIVPVSCPALTLKVPRAQVQVGDVVELRCEAQRGSPPILYQFYREDIPVGNNSAPSGGGASFNLSLTTEHSGNYSCEADNGLGARRSEAVLLSISGPAGSISGLVATGVTGGLFSALSFGVVALLLYCRLLRKAGGRPTSDPSRSPSDSDVREPTYHNVPAWMELQPVYSNVNHRGGEVVYSEVRRVLQGDRPAANSESTLGLLWTHLPSRCQAASHWPPDPQGSSVIYSQVKVVCPPVSAAPRS